MKQSERFALKHFLSRYPDDLCFEKILCLMNNEHEDVELAKSFKGIYLPDLTDLILNMVNDIESQFFPFHELVTVLDRDSVSDHLHQIILRKPTEEELNKVCSFLDSDFSSLLLEKIADSVTYLNIK